MTPTPIIKVREMAYPRLQVPDLDRMEAYLMDFGMVRAERRDGSPANRPGCPHHQPTQTEPIWNRGQCKCPRRNVLIEQRAGGNDHPGHHHAARALRRTG